MKKNWQTKKLGEICDFQRGLTYSKRDEVDFSGNVVLRANNIDLSKNALDLTDLRYISDSVEVPDNKKVKKGSIIICTASGSKSHLGKAAMVDQDYGYAFGGFMGQLLPKEHIDSKFLFYLLTSDAYKNFIERLSNGMNINNLKFDDLATFEVSFPPLQDQKKIVRNLDIFTAGVEKAQENTQKKLLALKELRRSVLKEALAE